MGRGRLHPHLLLADAGGLPFGRMLADINAGRLHNAAQYELMGRNLGSALLGVEGKPDFMV